MLLRSSYKVLVLNKNIFHDTVKKYREVLAYLIDVVNKEWTIISSVEGSLKQKQTVFLIPELAMETILNNEKDYATSEKSARYTKSERLLPRLQSNKTPISEADSTSILKSKSKPTFVFLS